MSGFEPIMNNPILAYRLDPCEPGLLRHAKASQSTIQVVSHEHRNLTRLSRQAIQEGRIILRKQITYKPVIAGSYMGIAAGKTTVVSTEKSKLMDEEPPEGPETNEKAQPSEAIGEATEGLQARMQPELARLSTEKLTQEEERLRIEVHRLNAELQQLDGVKPYSPGDVESAEVEQRQRELKLALEKKEQELQKVALAKMMKTQSELLTSVIQGLVESALGPMKMLELAYHGGVEGPGPNLDLVV